MTEQHHLDVCSYRLFPAGERRVKISWLASALNDFQEWFTVVFDSIKNGPKDRARFDADTVSETAFDFAYSFNGSVGIVLTMPNERLLVGETTLDKTFLAINEMSKAENSEQIANLAKLFGIASIRKMYQWTNDHVQSGLGADIQWRRGDTLAHRLRQLRAEYKREVSDATQDSILDRLSDYAKKNLFGSDFDPFLMRASTMNVLMAANVEGNIFHMDSLAFPHGHLPGNDLAKKFVPFGSVDVLMTNPPFGAEIPITEKSILDNLQLAKRWSKDDNGQ